MNQITRLPMLLSGFFLILNATSSWGQLLVNPTVSDAHGNTAGGTGALGYPFATPAPENTAFGYSALNFLLSGSGNTAVGWKAAELLQSGTGNTGIGDSALFQSDHADYNTASGYRALYTTLGSNNTANGAFALYLNAGGQFNVATGAEALRSNISGSKNTATGSSAMFGNISGQLNVATGAETLRSNTFGSNNTATGSSAMFGNTTGSQNTVVGVAALANNISGVKNTGIGGYALLQSMGNKNIAIGYQAGINLADGSNNIYLGNPGANESLTMRLGSVQTSTFIAGVANASVSDATVMIDTTTGQLGIVTSSARYKQDIAPMGIRSEKVLDLRPVTFAYKDDSKGTKHYGLIAEEVAAVYPELVTRTATGEVQTVRYQELIPMLLNELQRQQQTLERQQRELTELRALAGSRLDK